MLVRTLFFLFALSSGILAAQTSIPPVEPSSVVPRIYQELVGALDKVLAESTTDPIVADWAKFVGVVGLKKRSETKNLDRKTVSVAMDRLNATAELPNSLAGLRDALNQWYFITAVPPRADLSRWIRSFQTLPVSRPSDETLQVVRQKTKSVTAEFSQFLLTQEHGPLWIKALRLDLIQAKLAGPFEVTELALLRRACEILAFDPIHGKLAAVDLFVGVVGHYLALVELSASPDPQSFVQGKLESIAVSVEALDQDPSSFSCYLLRREIDWFQNVEGYADVVFGVKSYFAASNLVGSVSGTFLARGVDKTQVDYSPVADTILGNWVSGQARSQSAVKLLLVPNPSMGELAFRVVGEMTPNTVAYAKRATVTSVGRTDFVADKHVFITDKGAFSAPARATTATTGTITGVQVQAGWPFRRMANRIGWRKAYQSQPAALQESDFKARLKVEQKINGQVDKQVGVLNQGGLKTILAQATEFGVPISSLRYSTTSVNLWLSVGASLDGQLGAPSGIYPTGYLPAEFSIHVHQTALSNYFAQFARRKITPEGMQAMIQQAMATATGTSLAPVLVPEASPSPVLAPVTKPLVAAATVPPPPVPAPPIPITDDKGGAGETAKKQSDLPAPPTPAPVLAEKNASAPSGARVFLRGLDPVVVRFADNVMTVRIAAEKVETTNDDGETEKYGEREITLQFKIALTQEGILITPVGEILVLPPGRVDDSKLEFRDRAIQNGVREKLEEGLAEDYLLKPARFPGSLSFMGKPLLRSLQARQGWLSLSFDSLKN